MLCGDCVFDGLDGDTTLPAEGDALMAESGRTFTLLAAIVSLLAAAVPAQENPRLAVAGVAKTLSRPDLVLHYFEYGEGEPVLVLMGGPGLSGEGMEPVAQIIAKRARAIVPDQRGSGGSIPKTAEAITLEGTLADLEALRQALGITKWTVWGCSWGGSLALHYASKFPASLKGLVLVGSGPASPASFGTAFADNMAARMSADDRAAQRYWSQPDVVARDPERAAFEMLRAIIPSQFYDRGKANEAIAAFKPGREHYNPEAEQYLG
jgi:proline iminopeptidase